MHGCSRGHAVTAWAISTLGIDRKPRVLQSKRASEVQKDINAWEENRLFTSGVVRAREVRSHEEHGRLHVPPTLALHSAPIISWPSAPRLLCGCLAILWCLRKAALKSTSAACCLPALGLRLLCAPQNDLDFDADADVRTVLVVHDTMPPFLDGRVRFTKQADLVLPLRDPTSDMAVISRNGSHLVRTRRCCAATFRQQPLVTCPAPCVGVLLSLSLHIAWASHCQLYVR
jgi:hypothetical protein